MSYQDWNIGGYNFNNIYRKLNVDSRHDKTLESPPEGIEGKLKKSIKHKLQEFRMNFISEGTSPKYKLETGNTKMNQVQNIKYLIIILTEDVKYDTEMQRR